MIKLRLVVIRALTVLGYCLVIGTPSGWAIDEADDSIGQRHELRELSVEEHRRFNVGGVQMGALRLVGEDLKSIPSVFGEPDVLRALQATPGVQSGKNGNVGLMVRGGGYDQNTMMVDGAMLYSTDHLKGFVTAVNPDIVDNISFYRGAFPVQYSGRLSGVIDIEAKQGNFNRWQTEASLGISMARINAGGPIVRGKTSIAIAARMSYFDLIFRPIVNKHYDRIGIECPYSNLDFWDINAKLSQRIGRNDLVSLSVIADEDKQNSPARTAKESNTIYPYWLDNGSEVAAKTPYSDEMINIGNLIESSINQTGVEKTYWSNRIASLNWHHNFGDVSRHLITTVAYTSYRYNTRREGLSMSNKLVDFNDDYWRTDSIVKDYRDNTILTQHSDIRNLRIASVMSQRINSHHSLTYGVEARFVRFEPRRSIIRSIYRYENWCKKNTMGEMIVDRRDKLTTADVDTLISNLQTGKTFSAFIGDELSYGSFKASIGGNMTAYLVEGKSYMSFEPRLSLCYDLTKRTYLKASFSKMSQGERLLSSSSVKNPGDVWVTATDSVPPMRATQYAVSVSQRIPFVIALSIEGYYKQSTGNIEYLEGVDFANIASTWQQQVTIGRARSWGIELMAQRDAGPITGWLSYTFSRAHELYDTPGRAINNGAWFAAAADRPHNLQIFIQYTKPIKRFKGNSFDFAVHFGYMSGRKLTMPDHVTYAGMLQMADHYAYEDLASSWRNPLLSSSTYNSGIVIPDECFEQYMRFEGFSNRFNFVLPAESTFDITVAFNLNHRVGTSRLAVGATNLFNKKNVSTVYLTADSNGKTYLKGVCDFPIMPVLSYSYKF